MVGGLIVTALAFTGLAASGAISLKAPELELAPRVRVWRMMGTDPGHWPRMPPGQPLSKDVSELLIDNDRYVLRYDGTAEYPFALAAGPPTSSEDPPAPPELAREPAPDVDTTVNFHHNGWLTVEMTQGSAAVDATVYVSWQGLLLSGKAPTAVRWPLGTRPAGDWTLVDLSFETARRVAASETAVELRPFNTYLALFPGSGRAVIMRSKRESQFTLSAPAGSDPRTLSLDLRGGADDVFAYVGTSTPRLRLASGDELAAGAGGRHLIVQTRDNYRPNHYDDRALPTGPVDLPTDRPAVAIAWDDLIQGIRESSSVKPPGADDETAPVPVPVVPPGGQP